MSQASTVSYRMRYLWTVSLVAALGGLLFGYDWVVISGAKMFYEKHFHLVTSYQEGWATSCALVGCLLGAILAGGLSDRFGRRRLLILSGLLFVATGVGVALADDGLGAAGFTWFVVFRMLGGVGIGLASNISPMYIAEISPAVVRGKFVSLNQLTIVVGVLLAQGANWAIGTYGDRVDEQALAAAPAAPPRTAEFTKRFIAKYAPRIEGKKIDGFLAEQNGVPGNDALLDFLKKNKTSLTVNYVTLAEHELRPWNESTGWRWMFGAVTLPGLFFFLAMFFVPESPRWLVKNGRADAARAVLAKIGGERYAADEVTQIESTLVGEIEKVNFRDLLEPKMRPILLLGVMLAVLQQWCGLNAIFYYADRFFGAAAYQMSDILWSVVVLGSVNFAFTLIAIAFVDRVGRKALMLVGEAGLTILFLALGVAYALGIQGEWVRGLILAANACYCCTLAPITWVILSEIFPNRIRGAAMSVSVFVLWLTCYALAQLCPIFADLFSLSWMCWGFSAICAFGFVFLAFRLPETKGKSLEQIERELVD